MAEQIMINITDKSKCSGCSACYASCPVECIEMKQDEEGFYYPITDDKRCVQCGRCEKVCPILNYQRPEPETIKVYVCQNKDLETRKDSTSGGVFSALAQYILDKNGIVFGAEFDEQYNVRHSLAESKEAIERFRGSKYVQSWMGNTFRSVQEAIKSDRWVLFSGTPCQVAGLKAYLGVDYEKLVLMDIVCYSISSPGIWNQFIYHMNRKIPMDKVTKIKFRDKTKYGYEYSLMTFYDKDNNVVYSSGPESNAMLRSYVSNTSTRPSCYNCKFKTVERVSDFTAWDCYNIYQYGKELDDNIGSSHLLVHTNKGKQILEELDKYLTLHEVDANKAILSEPAMTVSACPSEIRDKFFTTYKEGNNVFDSFFLDTSRVKVERILRHTLSKIGVYKYIKRMMKG